MYTVDGGLCTAIESQETHLGRAGGIGRRRCYALRHSTWTRQVAKTTHDDEQCCYAGCSRQWWQLGDKMNLQGMFDRPTAKEEKSC